MDEIWKRDEIDSPCVKLCVVQPQSRLCVGCFRSIDEISAWSRMTPDTRKAIMGELQAREGKITQRRGGRRAGLGRAD